MAAFSYKARDGRGKLKTGTVEAANKGAAQSKLKSMRLKPITVRAVSAKSAGNSDSFLSNYIYKDEEGKTQIQLSQQLPTTKEMAIFTKQFSIMLERGVPLVQTLAILASQQKSRAFKKMIEKIREDVENGATLSDALTQHPKVFDNLYCAMVRAGEVSGSLDIILRQLLLYIERNAKLQSQLKRAMTYPVMVVLVAIIVIGMLLIFVVPSFAEQYSQGDRQLPQLTQIVINASNFFQEYFLYLAGGLIAAWFLLRHWMKTDNGKEIFDRYILKAPIVGGVIQKIAVSRFCGTMSTMLKSGVPILDALNICATSSGNAFIESFVKGVRSAIASGHNFSNPLQQSDLFPSMVVSMVAVGEQTGALDETMAKITEIYEDEVDQAIATMTSMIEPIMIVGIGSLVGFIMIAMYLPVFDMANNF